jgi:16S rRNA (guanine527-N7)-methyltransferase
MRAVAKVGEGKGGGRARAKSTDVEGTKAARAAVKGAKAAGPVTDGTSAARPGAKRAKAARPGAKRAKAARPAAKRAKAGRPAAKRTEAGGPAAKQARAARPAAKRTKAGPAGATGANAALPAGKSARPTGEELERREAEPEGKPANVDDARSAAILRYRRAGGDPEILEKLVELVGDYPEFSSKWRSIPWLLAEESVAATRDPQVRAARRMADIGTGAGFPGLVLASLLPEAEVALVELREDRHVFLDRAIEAMRLQNVVVVTLPAQEWLEGIGTRDLVTSRNVAPLNTVIELAAPLLAVGGSALLWSRPHREDEADGDAAAAITGLERVSDRMITKKACLYTYAKVSETPGWFPRSGIAAFRDPIRARRQEPVDLTNVELTTLEQDVIKLRARRMTAPEISEQLEITENQVQKTVRRVVRKLGVVDHWGAAARLEELAKLRRGGEADNDTSPG